jgi:hypothetical protein
MALVRSLRPVIYTGFYFIDQGVKDHVVYSAPHRGPRRFRHKEPKRQANVQCERCRGETATRPGPKLATDRADAQYRHRHSDAAVSAGYRPITVPEPGGVHGALLNVCKVIPARQAPPASSEREASNGCGLKTDELRCGHSRARTYCTQWPRVAELQDVRPFRARVRTVRSCTGRRGKHPDGPEHFACSQR